VTGPGGPAERRARRSRRRGLAALLVLLGAAGSAGGAFLPWWRRAYRDPLSGDMTVAVDGADVAVALVPLAFVAVAALAAAMISRGMMRRLLGVVVALAAAAAGACALLAATLVPSAVFAAALLRPATPLEAPQVAWAPVLLAVAAALAGVAGGVLVAYDAGRVDASGRLSGTVYRTPAARRDAARSAVAAEASQERGGVAGDAGGQGRRDSTGARDQPDIGAWWQALDAGVDPTDDGGMR
jgi:uncharacterized membrane protein (TIGR02234 family)